MLQGLLEIKDVWVTGLYGHSRRQGDEASTVDLVEPRKYIHLGLVDWKLLVNSGPQEADDPFQ